MPKKEVDAKAKKSKKGKDPEAKAAEDAEFEAALQDFAPASKAPAEEKAAEEAAEKPAEKPAEKVEERQKEKPAEPEEKADGASSASKSKKGKKGKDPAKAEEDAEFDAVLQDFKPKEEEKAAEKQPEKPAEPDEEDKENGEAALDAKALANRRKKEKKKAKMAAGGEGMWSEPAEAGAAPAGEAAAEEAEEPPAPAASSKKGSKAAKAVPKKESAVVKAARERMEAERKLEEERRAFLEKQRIEMEEQERREREERERRDEELRLRREKKKAKIEKMKEEGTFQTKKDKDNAKRAAQLRAMYGFDMNEEEEEQEEEAAPEAKPKRRPLAGKKKKPPKAAVEEEASKAEEEEAGEAEAPAAEAAKVEEKPAAPADDDDDDDWEAQAEKAEEEAAQPAEEESESEDEDEDESDSDSSDSDDDKFRSPIICIMGHVDTGKTKLLDKIRRTNIQEGEAGGITQQIGATFFPDIALQEQTRKVDDDFEIEVPGLLVIDTPGHESFNNLRKRGSSLCDLAILVIDIMHGLEPQTVESLEMLKKRRCPFIVALNKVDRCYQWKDEPWTSIRDALDRQEDSVKQDFYSKLKNIKLQLNERGLNCDLYWENTNKASTVSIVPTSALTGEGVPDLLYMLLYLSQELIPSSLQVEDELQCTVIDVKTIDGLGTTIDVVLVNGTLKEGDTIVLAGMGSTPIVTTIRALLTPQPMKEMRVKSEYVHHSQISTSMGVKISAPELENAVAGTDLKVLGPEDDLEDLKEEVQDGFESILKDFEKQPAGVYVKASTLGSLEALLSFLQDSKIPVFDVGIGEVHKKDVKKALIMKDKHKEYAVILCFDVKVSTEASQLAAAEGVQIMTADIIYHLQEKFTAYMANVQSQKKTETRLEAVFPVIMQIDKQYIFHKRDPIVLGCKIVGGQLRVGTPICVPEKGFLEIGRVGGIEKDRKPVPVARRGDNVCVKIEQSTAQNHIAIGRHFEHTNQLYSAISRASIDTLKAHFRDEMTKDDWEMVVAMKSVFSIE